MASEAASEKYSSSHGNWCAAFGCTTAYRKKEGKSMFRFPKDPDRCAKWVQNSRVEGLRQKTPQQLYKNYRLCQEHFEDCMFMNAALRNSLVHNAIPTIFSVPNPPPRIATKRTLPCKVESSSAKRAKPTKVDVSDTAWEDVADNTHGISNDTPRRRKLKSTINRQRVQICRMRSRLFQPKTHRQKPSQQISKIIDLAKEFLPDHLLSFFENQMNMSLRKKKGCRFTEQDKTLALAIYFQSPKSYRLLTKFFRLPSVRSVKRYVQHIKIEPGFSDHVFELLKQKVDVLSECHKQCVITFDEMTLKCAIKYDSAKDYVFGLEDFGLTIGRGKKICNQALVFMVRGLVCKWKQPIAFFFSCDATNAITLQDLLKQAIDKVSKIGLNVKAVVCDQGSANRALYKSLGITPDQPYFVYNDHKIFGLFDPPHLIKSVRNNLQKYQFILQDKVIKWSYIKEVYEKDSKLPIRMCPKLSKKHIKLTNFSKMRVNLATQILSHSVAAAIMTYVSLGALPEDAIHTAHFISLFDKLFDCFNSGRIYDYLKPHRAAFSDTSVHLQFLSEMQETLASIKVESKNTVHFLNGLKISVAALKELWVDLQSNDSLQFLLTNRLNQDCLENMFSVIRQSGGCRDNPNAEQFCAAYKQYLVNRLFSPPQQSNCATDSDVLITSLASFAKQTQSVTDASTMPQNYDVLPDNTLDQTVTEVIHSLPERNILQYISGYIVFRLNKIHVACNECKLEVLGSKGISTLSSNQQFLYHKQLIKEKDTNTGLTVPSSDMVKLITECEDVFINEFENIVHLDHIKPRLINRLKCTVTCNMQVCSRAMDIIFDKYMTLRIHAAVRFKNREMAEGPLKKNRKVLKVLHL